MMVVMMGLRHANPFDTLSILKKGDAGKGGEENVKKRRIINLIDDCMAAGRGGNYQQYSNR